MSVYAVSDIHGQLDIFLAGLKKIDLQADDQLYVIGDAIDRGPDGIKILQYIMDHPNIDLLIGNHELLMLNSVDPEGKKKCNGPDSDLWTYYNGGRVTFEEYEKLQEKTRIALLEWLRGRYVIRTIDVNERSFCLTHSYYDPAFENQKYSEMEYEDVWDIVWRSVYRDDRATRGRDIYRDYDHTFITGHVPVQRIMRRYTGRYDFNQLRIYEKGNFICIDGGCAMGVRDEINNGLLFLRLDDMEVTAVPMIGRK